MKIAKIFFNTNKIILSRCRYKQHVSKFWNLMRHQKKLWVGLENKTKQNKTWVKNEKELTIVSWGRYMGTYDSMALRQRLILILTAAGVSKSWGQSDQECTSDHQLPKQEFLTNTWCWTKLHFQDLHTQEKNTRTNHFVLSGMKPKNDKITDQHSLIFDGERFMFSFFFFDSTHSSFFNVISNFKFSTYCKFSINPPGGLFISKTFMGGGGGAYFFKQRRWYQLS